MATNTSIRVDRFIWEPGEIVVEKAAARQNGYERHVKRLERRLAIQQIKLSKAQRERRPTGDIERAIKSLQALVDLV
jgi:hypothetical protein